MEKYRYKEISTHEAGWTKGDRINAPRVKARRKVVRYYLILDQAGRKVDRFLKLENAKKFYKPLVRA